MNALQRRIVGSFLAALCLLGGVFESAAAAPSQGAVGQDLLGVFSEAGLLRDTNKDGVFDYADAEVRLGRTPTDEDVAAAANIAARIGFEVTSLDLPLKRQSPAGLLILVGGAAVHEFGDPGLNRMLDGISAGAGLVLLTEAKGQRILVAAGSDGGGTRRAAEAIFAWLPTAAKGDAPLKGLVDGVSSRFGGSKAAIERIDTTVDGGTIWLRVDTQTASVSAASPVALALPGRWTVELVGRDGVANSLTIQPLKTVVAHAEPAAPVKPIDLAQLYSLNGVLADDAGGLIPTHIRANLSGEPALAAPTVELGARLGLETAGYDTRLAIPADAPDLEKSSALILLGQDHPLVRAMIDSGAFAPPHQAPGEGAITLLPPVGTSGGSAPTTIVVTGGDLPGSVLAAEFLATTAPNLTRPGRGNPTLSDVSKELDAFLSARSPAGQAARADVTVRELTARLKSERLQAVSLSLSLNDPDPGLGAFFETELHALLPEVRSVSVKIEDRNVRKAHPIEIEGKPFVIDETLRSELSDFWALIDSSVLPEVRKSPSSAVKLEARLSEAPEVRTRVAAELRAKLISAGADPAQLSVIVLSAYKQGFSWLNEVAGPALDGRRVDHVVIHFADLTPPPEWPNQTTLTPTRWLKEIYPIDAVLAKRLGIDEAKIRFDEAPSASSTYKVEAFDTQGQLVYTGAFDPKFVIRSMFDVFPDYEKVHVTTGWVQAVVGDKTVVDQRVETDIERLWDIYQGQVLPALKAHVLNVSKGKPNPNDAPFFGELEIAANLSEPDYKLGVGQEAISSIDAIDEDLLFFTKTFFSQLGLETIGKPLGYVGRIIPKVRPAAPGEPEHVRVRLTGFDAPAPMASLHWQKADGGWTEADSRISAQSLKPSELRQIRIRPGGALDLVLRQEVLGDSGELATTIKHLRTLGVIEATRQNNIEASTARDMVAFLRRAQSVGLYKRVLAFPALKGIDLEFVDRQTAAIYPGANLVLDGVRLDDGHLSAPCTQTPMTPLVQWAHAISPSENERILACMQTLPGASVSRAATSYLGRPVWELDIAEPEPGRLVSRTKLTVSKPVILITARRHANEVSSTSHVLKFADQLLTTPKGAEMVREASFAIVPISNPDGAAIVEELEPLSPNLMLHSGRFTGLVEDLLAPTANLDLMPEYKVPEDLADWWLPDVNLDPHGLNSHEWVSPFGEYVGWPMNRTTVIREVWIPRGWHLPTFDFPAGERFAAVRKADFAILDRISEAMNDSPATKHEIESERARYIKYGTTYDPIGFPMNVVHGVTTYYSTPFGFTVGGGRVGGAALSPAITIFSSATEAEDEVVSGDALASAAQKGLAWERAIVGYVLDHRQAAERHVTASSHGAYLLMSRQRISSDPANAKEGK